MVTPVSCRGRRGGLRAADGRRRRAALGCSRSNSTGVVGGGGGGGGRRVRVVLVVHIGLYACRDDGGESGSIACCPLP